MLVEDEFQKYLATQSKKMTNVHIRYLNEYDGMYDLQVMIDEVKAKHPHAKQVYISTNSHYSDTTITLYATVEESEDAFLIRTQKKFLKLQKDKEKRRKLKDLEAEYGPFIAPNKD